MAVALKGLWMDWSGTGPNGDVSDSAEGPVPSSHFQNDVSKSLILMFFEVILAKISSNKGDLWLRKGALYVSKGALQHRKGVLYTLLKIPKKHHSV